jgi:hypothetical protein
VQRLAGQKLLCDLALDYDAMGSVLGHGLSSFESPACRSIVKSVSVRPEGPTPDRRPKLNPFLGPAPARRIRLSPSPAIACAAAVGRGGEVRECLAIF